MDTLKKYSIAYKGLSVGRHNYELELNDLFFNAFDDSPILSGSGVVRVEVNKNSSMLTLMFDIEAKVGVECDRCLDEVLIPVNYNGELVVRFSETESDYDGEIMWLSAAEDSIPLAQYIYESVCLNLPYQRVHPMDENGHSECNPEMLEKFRIISEQEFAKLTPNPEDEKGLEPSQWAKLKELKDKMEQSK